LYVYQAEQGYTVHIAGSRVAGEVPHIDWGLLVRGDLTAFVAQNRAQSEYLASAEREKIDLQYAGDTFVVEELEDLERLLLELRGIGYRFPEWVLERVREENVN
jgi:hypothetical protein